MTFPIILGAPAGTGSNPPPEIHLDYPDKPGKDAPENSPWIPPESEPKSEPKPVSSPRPGVPVAEYPYGSSPYAGTPVRISLATAAAVMAEITKDLPEPRGPSGVGAPEIGWKVIGGAALSAAGATALWVAKKNPIVAGVLFLTGFSFA